MKLTKKTDYALRVLVHLSEPNNQRVISRDLAESQNLSLKFLQSVVSELVKRNWVESVSGPKGGISLLIDPSAITVFMVLEAMEGETTLMDCMEESSQCNEFSRCKIHSLFGRAQLAVNEILSGTRIIDLVHCPIDNQK